MPGIRRLVGIRKPRRRGGRTRTARTRAASRRNILKAQISRVGLRGQRYRRRIR